MVKMDAELIEAAKEIIRKRYKQHWHVVGAAMRMASGRIYAGVHLEATVGRAAICAEAVALGKAVCEGEEEIDTVVAVYHPAPEASGAEIQVVAPCGVCREMIADYGANARVIVPGPSGPEVLAITQLLPRKYRHP